MDSDFFGDSGDIAIQNQQYGREHFQSQDNAPDQQFQFSDPNQYVGIETLQQQTYSAATYQPDLQGIKKIQEEQDKINQQLREKSNKQYEAKQKRKDQGRRQYQQFMATKQKQLIERKKENVQKQKRLIENNAKLSEQAGWKKVAANVPLKQGEHKGMKDVTRMRESIINKKNDQSN